MTVAGDVPVFKKHIGFKFPEEFPPPAGSVGEPPNFGVGTLGKGWE
jgi:hypothetical protein